MRSLLPARLLAPLALVASALAVYLVVKSEMDSPGSSGKAKSTSARSTGTGAKTSTTKATTRTRRRTYRVKAGDTLSGIAEDTGVSLARIQELNPDLDASTLRTGATIKLSP